MLFGCGARRPAVFAAADLAERGLDRIVVMPVADERPFPSDRIALTAWVRDAVSAALADRGYHPIAPIAAASGTPAVSPPPASFASLLDADGEVLAAAAAGAGEDGQVLFVAVDSVRSERDEIGADVRVRLVGVLVDRTEREVIWRDRAERESSISGAGAAVINPWVRLHEAVVLAATSLVATLPDVSR